MTRSEGTEQVQQDLRMDKQPLEATRERRIGRVVLVVAIASVLILAAIATIFYRQMIDQENAKYRAQYETIKDIVRVIPIVDATVGNMMHGTFLYYIPNATWDKGVRFAYGDFSAGTLLQLSSECKSISVMYEAGTERNTVFSNLSGRFEIFTKAVWAGMSKLNSWDQQFNYNYTSQMEYASEAMVQIGELLSDGIRPDIDGLEHPYDILAGINLAEVEHYSVVMWYAAWYAWHAFDLP